MTDLLDDILVYGNLPAIIFFNRLTISQELRYLSTLALCWYIGLLLSRNRQRIGPTVKNLIFIYLFNKWIIYTMNIITMQSVIRSNGLPALLNAIFVKFNAINSIINAIKRAVFGPNYLNSNLY